MIQYPNAKINLGLHITEKRPDGFHNLETIFYPIGLSDILEILDRNPGESDPGMQFSSSGISIPGEGNLCSKAFDVLKNDFPEKMAGAHCAAHLHKIVPIGAGLGGGSSDAAFALRMLNEMYALGLAQNKLEEYAARLGSDCPFFIQNKPIFATGRGEIFESVNIDLSNYYLKLLVPEVHVSTPWAYGQIKPKKPSFDLRELGSVPLQDWAKVLVNDFEAPVFAKHPEIASLKEQLYKEGAIFASMSGSGSAVFGIFSNKPVHADHPTDCTVWIGKLD